MRLLCWATATVDVTQPRFIRKERTQNPPFPPSTFCFSSVHLFSIFRYTHPPTHPLYPRDEQDLTPFSGCTTPSHRQARSDSSRQCRPRRRTAWRAMQSTTVTTRTMHLHSVTTARRMGQLIRQTRASRKIASV